MLDCSPCMRCQWCVSQTAPRPQRVEAWCTVFCFLRLLCMQHPCCAVLLCSAVCVCSCARRHGPTAPCSSAHDGSDGSSHSSGSSGNGSGRAAPTPAAAAAATAASPAAGGCAPNGHDGATGCCCDASGGTTRPTYGHDGTSRWAAGALHQQLWRVYMPMLTSTAI